MKKILFLFFTLCAFVNAQAQDVIVKNDNSTILAKVLTVDSQNVSYKKWDNQNGPTYTLSIKEITRINYANGTVDKFDDNTKTTTPTPTVETNSTLPSITRSDIERIVYKSNAGRGKIIGGACVIGLVGVPSLLGGIMGLIVDAPVGLSSTLLVVGAISTGIGWGIVSNGRDERSYANVIRSTPIVTHKIVKGDVAYTPSLNVLQDNFTHSKALGLGFNVSF